MLNKIIGHEHIIDKLKNFLENIPHVLIFSGLKNVGKFFTAINFIDEIYQGKIYNRWNCHPDIHIYTPEDKTFKIEDIHKIQDTIDEKPFELNKKFYILENIHLMRKEASNAMLKMLEDHPEFVRFFLLTQSKEKLLDTIKSRSVILEFYPIKNLRLYFPEINDLQEKIVNGCIGNYEEIKGIDIENIYLKIMKIISEKLSYSEILETYNLLPKINFDILYRIIAIGLLEIGNIKNISILKEKLNMYLNLEIHFKNFLLEFGGKFDAIK